MLRGCSRGAVQVAGLGGYWDWFAPKNPSGVYPQNYKGPTEPFTYSYLPVSVSNDQSWWRRIWSPITTATEKKWSGSPLSESEKATEEVTWVALAIQKEYESKGNAAAATNNSGSYVRKGDKWVWVTKDIAGQTTDNPQYNIPAYLSRPVGGVDVAFALKVNTFYDSAIPGGHARIGVQVDSISGTASPVWTAQEQKYSGGTIYNPLDTEGAKKAYDSGIAATLFKAARVAGIVAAIFISLKIIDMVLPPKR